MSRLQTLVADLCSDGVEHCSLESLGSIFTGLSGKTKADFHGGSTPYVSYTNVFSNPATDVEPTDFVRVAPEERQNAIRKGDVLFTASSENADECAMSSVVMVEPPRDTLLNSFCFGFRLHDPEMLIPEFSKHLFRAPSIRSQIAGTANGVTRFNVSKSKFLRIRVPVPPVEVQAAVAGPLTKAESLKSELESELLAELELRRQQYRYYRGSLLVPAGGEEGFERLGDLASNLDARRQPVTKSARESGPIPYYGASGVVDHVKNYLFDGDYLLVSEDGANLLARSTPIAFSVSGKCWVNNHAHVLEFDSYSARRYVEFFLNSIDLAPYITGSTQPKLSRRNLDRIQIPLVGGVEQERIVSTLDELDALTNELTALLPTEVDARREQYEYFRDSLLAFGQRAA